MDIYCKFCGEPWDHDSLHEFDDYPRRSELFRKLGCPALKYEDTEITDDNCIEGKINGVMKLRKLDRAAAEKFVNQHYIVDSRLAARSEVAMELSDYSDDWLF